MSAIALQTNARGLDFSILKEMAVLADEEGYIRVSMQTLADALRIHHDTVKRSIGRFVQDGTLTRYHRASGTGCNKYLLAQKNAGVAAKTTPATFQKHERHIRQIPSGVSIPPLTPDYNRQGRIPA